MKRPPRYPPPAVRDGPRSTGPERPGAVAPPAGGAGEPPDRSAGGAAAATGPGGRSTAPDPRARLQERTADLQRLKAEYDNYRKRVRRDRLAVREIAVANVLDTLLPVLDAIDGARAAGEVTGGFERVVGALEGGLTALGLRSVGRPGEPFDPTVHQALQHAHDDRVASATCAVVHRPGYRVGDHLLRPAQVTVVDPPPEATGPGTSRE
ncbi:nucleotide exchange factor GrpE [Streptomyces sp. NPDC018031]|uniref:nucleotide exchange factor GrpE n=1 Tax=Streptomyces sp. NPDC018031 TaxID=3365033 RepID=UPI00379B3533